jgi:hypothetical protein
MINRSPEAAELPGLSHFLMISGLRSFQQIPRRIMMTMTRMRMKTVFGLADAIAHLYFRSFHTHIKYQPLQKVFNQLVGLKEAGAEIKRWAGGRFLATATTDVMDTIGLACSLL